MERGALGGHAPGTAPRMHWTGVRPVAVGGAATEQAPPRPNPRRVRRLRAAVRPRLRPWAVTPSSPTTEKRVREGVSADALLTLSRQSLDWSLAHVFNVDVWDHSPLKVEIRHCQSLAARRWQRGKATARAHGQLRAAVVHSPRWGRPLPTVSGAVRALPGGSGGRGGRGVAAWARGPSRPHSPRHP